MKKMTDEERRKLIYENSRCMACCEYIDALDHACAFYDAQIDAQAKTMEELLDIWTNKGIANDIAFKYVKNKDINGEMKFAFSCAVNFFLAAGGRIKE